MVALGDHDPKVSAPTLFRGEDQDARGVDRKPRRVLARMLPHRIDDAAQERSAALNQVRECRARQMHAEAFEDALLPVQRHMVAVPLHDHVRDQARSGNRARDGPVRQLGHCNG